MKYDFVEIMNEVKKDPNTFIDYYEFNKQKVQPFVTPKMDDEQLRLLVITTFLLSKKNSTVSPDNLDCEIMLKVDFGNEKENSANLEAFNILQGLLQAYEANNQLVELGILESFSFDNELTASVQLTTEYAEFLVEHMDMPIEEKTALWFKMKGCNVE